MCLRFLGVSLTPPLFTIAFLLALSSKASQAQTPAQVADPATNNGGSASAGTGNQRNWADSFAQMSLQELVELEVTTASKKSEKLSDVASAIFVLTAEDIRRSGASTLPDALRLVPGVNVGQIDGNQWAVSVRGFNGVFSDKLLVLIDGRSVYTPLFSGVIWAEHDIPLEEIERVEVIRGPGAALWGANAVNGVINIITKSSDKTHGVLVSAGGGKEEKVFGTVRYGDKFADTDYRFYAKATSTDQNHLESGGSAHDDWQSYRGGFRSDTRLTNQDTLTVQGDSLYSETGWDGSSPDLITGTKQSVEERRYNTQNILARWTRTFSPKSELMFQSYWDRVDRNDVLIQTRRNTFDLNSQYRFSPATAHDLIVGAEYRVYRDSHEDSFIVNIDPDSRTIGLYTGFLQDDITLIPNLLRLIIGGKYEYSDLSGPEFMPNVRAVTTLDEKNTVWASVSRAVRTPTRFNRDGHYVSQVIPSYVGNTPAALTVNGSSDFKSEELIAYEVGYRTQIHDKVAVDVATFYNDYDRLSPLEARDPVPQIHDNIPYIELPTIVTNGRRGKVYGGEALLDIRPNSWWRLVCSYSHFNMIISTDDGGNDLDVDNPEKQTPHDQVAIRSQINLPHQVELDGTLRYVGSVSGHDVGSYYNVDAHVGWHLSQNIELALVGRNLLHNSRIEYASDQINTARIDIDRAVFGKITYRF